MKLFGLTSKGNFKKRIGISAVLLLTITIDAAIIDTWIVCGQSNAEGYGITESPVSGLAPADTLPGIGRPDLNVTHNNVRFYQMGTELWAASSAGLSSFPNETWHSMLPHEGLCYDLGSGLGNESGRRFGPELSFGYEMQSYLGGEIAIIKQARGSATLASGTTQNGDGYWNDYDPTDTRNNQYDKLVTAITNAVNALPPGDTLRIQGVLWMQGEGDAVSSTMANAYGANLTEFISELRSSLTNVAASSGTKLIPATSWNETRFFVGKIAGGGTTPRVNAIRSAMDAVAAADANVWTVEAKDGMTFMTNDDWGNGGLHYDTAGQVLLGERFYATALGSMIGEFVDPETPSSALPVSGGTNWKLNFSDEFNGTSLDNTKWGIDVSTQSRNPRPTQGIADWWWKSENVTIDGSGYVALHVTKFDSNTMHCGSISSDSLYEPQYGYLEARIKIADTTKSTHTAFWLQGPNMNNTDPADGTANDGAEVDIFESAWFGDYTKSVVHYDGYDADHRANTQQYSTPNLHSGYHVFGLEWTAGSMKIYYDGVLKVTYSGIWVPQVAEWLWLSAGASFGDVGTFTSEPNGPLTSAEVDYVRVWKAAAETTPPSIVSTIPAHGSTSANPGDDLVITFNENIAFGTGNINLRLADGTLVESFDAGAPSPRLTLSGTSITINPTALLTASTGHYIEIAATAIDDLAGNSFAGFSGDGTWSFTTAEADTTNPLINTLSPANGATGVAATSNLVVTFNENVAFGSGNITLRHSGGALIETFDVASPPAGLTLSGATVTINPAANLAGSISYYVEIDATAIDDLSGNSYAGFSGSSTWSFTVVSAPLGATAAASSYINENTAPSKTIDNSGMSGETHGSSTQQSWMSTDTNNLANEWIQWDLGATYILGRIHVWNYNDSSRFDSGINNLDIYVSALANPGDPEGAGAADWTKIGTDVTMPIAPGAGTYTGFDLETETGISLPATAIRWVRFEVNSTHWDGASPGNGLGANQAALSEIRFYEAAEVSGETFADWIGGYTGLGGLTAFDDDADGDGIKNGIEAFFGTAPNARNAGLAAVAVSGSSLIFTHPEADPPLTNLTGSYEWSLDLSAWNASGDDVGGTIVTIGAVQDTPESGTTTVTSTVSGTEPGKVFVRAVATQN